MHHIDPDHALAEAEAEANPDPLDQYENALCVYLKRTREPLLSDILAWWEWRVGMDRSVHHLLDITSTVWDTCERLSLLRHSLAMPGGWGSHGVMCDAAPDRAGRLLLKPMVFDNADQLYWYRILSVLCSRLCHAEIKHLPGYDHDTTVGPLVNGRAPE